MTNIMWDKWYQLPESKRVALIRVYGSAFNAAYALFGENPQNSST
jgi:hypothetical protein